MTRKKTQLSKAVQRDLERIEGTRIVVAAVLTITTGEAAKYQLTGLSLESGLLAVTAICGQVAVLVIAEACSPSALILVEAVGGVAARYIHMTIPTIGIIALRLRLNLRGGIAGIGPAYIGRRDPAGKRQRLQPPRRIIAECLIMRCTSTRC